MSALTADFDSNIRNSRGITPYPANATVYAASGYFRGQLLQLNASGEAIPAAINVAYKIVGRLVRVSPDGLQVEAEEGDVLMNIGGSSQPAQADIGAQVYAMSDNEVTKDTGSTNAKAGILIGIEGTQARVRVTLEASL